MRLHRLDIRSSEAESLVFSLLRWWRPDRLSALFRARPFSHQGRCVGVGVSWWVGCLANHRFVWAHEQVKHRISSLIQGSIWKCIHHLFFLFLCVRNFRNQEDNLHQKEHSLEPCQRHRSTPPANMLGEERIRGLCDESAAHGCQSMSGSFVC